MLVIYDDVVIPCAALDGVIAPADVDEVIARSAGDRIVSPGLGRCVIPDVLVVPEVVVARAAEDRIVAPAPQDFIAGVVCDEAIGKRTALNAFNVRERHVARRAGHRASAKIDDGRRPEENHVEIAPAIHQVVTGRDVDQVPMVAPDERIVPPPPSMKSPEESLSFRMTL